MDLSPSECLPKPRSPQKGLGPSILFLEGPRAWSWRNMDRSVGLPPPSFGTIDLLSITICVVYLPCTLHEVMVMKECALPCTIDSVIDEAFRVSVDIFLLRLDADVQAIS